MTKRLRAKLTKDFKDIDLEEGRVIDSIVYTVESRFTTEDAVYYNGVDLVTVSYLSQYAEVEYYEE